MEMAVGIAPRRIRTTLILQGFQTVCFGKQLTTNWYIWIRDRKCNTRGI